MMLVILVQAKWLPWNQWTGCSVTCGQGGSKTRTRNFIPGRHGAEVKPKGEETETKSCGWGQCPGEILQSKFNAVDVYWQYMYIIAAFDDFSSWTKLESGTYRSNRLFAKTPFVGKKGYQLIFPFFRFLTMTSWTDAKRLCEQVYNSKMLEIDSEAENTAINNELRKRKARGWLGFTDKRSEGKWVLESTRGTATFTAWRKGEPNNQDLDFQNPEEHYAHTDPADDKWNDCKGQGKAGQWGALAVCEK